MSILSGETSSAAANGFPLLGNVANGEYKDSILNTNNPDGFIARFGVTGVLKWSTYFGGTGADGTYNVTADASKTLYITGSTASSNFDMESYGNAYQQTPNLAAGEVYFAAFTPSNHLLWSTGFGGLQFEGSAELATYGNEWLYFGANSYSLASTFPWDYPTGGYIDTNKTNVTNNAPYVGRFGIQNINVTSPSWQAPSFGINLFPNPTNTNSTIQISGLYGDCIEIAIVDMLGQVVFNRKIDSVFGTLYEQIETSTWGSGIYLVSVQSNNHGLITKKLIKQ